MNKNIILLFSFIITFLICIGVNTQDISPKFDQKLKEEVFWTNKVHNKEKYDFVIMGDSRSLRGINPSLMNTGLNGFNFSFPSAGLNEFYLKKSLDKLKKGGSLIISMTPFSFTKKAYRNEKIKEYLNLSFLEQQINKNYKLKRAFSGITKEKFNNKPDKHIKEFKLNGYVATKVEKNNPESGVDTYKRNFSNQKYSVEKLKTFIAILDQYRKDYEIYLVRMPVYSKVLDIENTLGKFDEELVKKLVIENSLKWIDSFEQEFETYDGSHLTIEAASQYSIKTKIIK